MFHNISPWVVPYETSVTGVLKTGIRGWVMMKPRLAAEFSGVSDCDSLDGVIHYALQFGGEPLRAGLA